MNTITLDKATMGTAEPTPETPRDTRAQEQAHRAALAACLTKKAMIRYTCEQTGAPSTEFVIDWLKDYGVEVSRSNTSTVVNEWRRERGIADTGEIAKLTEEMLASLERGQTPDTNTGQNAEAFEHGPDTGSDSEQDTAAGMTTNANTIEREHPAEVFDPNTNSGSEHDRTNTADTPNVFESRSLPGPDPDVEREHNVLVSVREHSITELPAAGVPDAFETTDVSLTAGGAEHGPDDADTFDTRSNTTTFTPEDTSAPEDAHVPNTNEAKDEKATPPGAFGFYLVSVMSLLVSLDTSWLFFEERLHIENLWIRGGMFAVLEAALIACGVGMAAGVRRHGRPGPAQLSAWTLCALSAYMAVALAGPVDGFARVALGPVLGMIMLHHALGIEKREHANNTGTLARLAREIRERVLSRLGLANDERDAARRTRDRAARRVAKLSLRPHVLFRQARLDRALAAANVAHDPEMRKVMLAELAARRHAGELATLAQESPWTVEDHQ